MPSLKDGDPLMLRREPANPHDALAIEVLTADGAKLGYIPRAANPPFARLMDAGFPLSAHLTAVRPGRWEGLRMGVEVAAVTGGRA